MEWCRGGEEMEWWPVGTLNSEERAGEASEHGDVRLSAGEAAGLQEPSLSGTTSHCLAASQLLWG